MFFDNVLVLNNFVNIYKDLGEIEKVLLFYDWVVKIEFCVEVLSNKFLLMYYLDEYFKEEIFCEYFKWNEFYVNEFKLLEFVFDNIFDFIKCIWVGFMFGSFVCYFVGYMIIVVVEVFDRK